MKIGTKKTYAGVLDIPAKKLKGVTVRHVEKPAGTTLASVTARTALFGQIGEKLTFAEPTRWHVLEEKGRGVWMTDYPVEQRQTDELIARSNGRVLVGGLGLGYAVVALAARPKVTEIVVVESNPAIIKLVWDATVTRARQTRTQTTDKPIKLSVIEADLFDYLTARREARLTAKKTTTTKPEFNWALFDIWQGDGETTFHEVVVPLRALAHGVATSVVCWNEDVMRGQLMQGLEIRFMMLRNPVAFPPSAVVPTLDKLTTDSDNVWTQWSVPFWRWYRDHQQEDEGLVRLVMKLYVKGYGRPEATNGVPALRAYRSKPVEAEAVAG